MKYIANYLKNLMKIIAQWPAVLFYPPKLLLQRVEEEGEKVLCLLSPYQLGA